MKDNPFDPDAPTKSKKFQPSEQNAKQDYIDESLLPTFRDALEYEDEYDDTYDELGCGMTEPDNLECKPLNQKRQVTADADEEDDDEEESTKDAKKLDLYEDPAIVRARLERRREDKHHNHQRRGPPPPSNDVVGKLISKKRD